MNRKLLTALLATSLLMWLVGCSESPTQTADEEVLNLNSEFGGYTTEAENPGFGDNDLLGEEATEVEYNNDEMLASPEVDSVISDPRSSYYHLRAVWGRLLYDSTVTTVTDWGGTLNVPGGVVIVRRTIRFEPGQDYIVRLRCDGTGGSRCGPGMIGWVSKTTVHNDGIAVDIFVPPPRPIFDSSEVAAVDSLGDTSWTVVIDTIFPQPEPVTVSFDTGPYSHTFNLEDLKSLDTIVYLDDSNAVAFHAFELNRYPCPRGFLAGRWGFDESEQGRFRGVWWSKRPNAFGWTVSGYLKGHFGPNSSGDKVFFGKWISRTGAFKGFLKGIYGHPPGPGQINAHGRHAHGWFSGRIYAADRTPIGRLMGKYRSAPRHGNGFFQGRWKLFCNSTGPELTDNEEGF